LTGAESGASSRAIARVIAGKHPCDATLRCTSLHPPHDISQRPRRLAQETDRVFVDPVFAGFGFRLTALTQAHIDTRVWGDPVIVDSARPGCKGTALSTAQTKNIRKVTLRALRPAMPSRNPCAAASKAPVSTAAQYRPADRAARASLSAKTRPARQACGAQGSCDDEWNVARA